MSECECLEKCPFFKAYLEDATAIRKIYVDRCCHGDYLKCARYSVAKRFGRENVPLDLYPLEMDRAQKIIAELEKTKKPRNEKPCE